MRVVQVTAVDGEIIESLGRLIPQLSTSAAIPTADRLKRLVAGGAAQLLIARDPDQEDRIVGTLTLVLFRIPTGVRAWIEDVVVDESARRRGVGELLCRAAIERARSAGARNLDLTSRPAREGRQPPLPAPRFLVAENQPVPVLVGTRQADPIQMSPSGGRRLSCRRTGAAAFLPPIGSGGFLVADWERRFLSPIGSGGFLVADWERRLSCRRLGAAAFLAAVFLSTVRSTKRRSPSPPLCSQQSPASIIPASVAPGEDPGPFIHSCLRQVGTHDRHIERSRSSQATEPARK